MKPKMIYSEGHCDQDLKSRGLFGKYKAVMGHIGTGKSVLEIGCWNGYFTEQLMRRQCEVTAVEIHPEMAQKAAAFAKRIIIGDIEDEKVLNELACCRFDVILFMDVLEHLVDPWQILRRMKSLLNSSGYILITIPNVASWPTRRQLLFGNFEYSEAGVLDKTHLRFFTLKTARELITSSGFRIEHWSVIDSYMFLEGKLRLLPFVRNLALKIKPYIVRWWPTLCGVVFLFKALPIVGEENRERRCQL